jgi:copper chaperone CopZ
VCAHAVRVALKNIGGVENVDVSLSKGEAVATFAPGNAVRYEQLLRAIEKNGFAVKGATVVATGKIAASNGGYELQISGSNEGLRLEPQSGAATTMAALVGKSVEVTGTVPEVAKGKSADVLRYSSMVEKSP